GTGGAAEFSNPRNIVLDSAGNVYVADENNDAIRKGTHGPALMSQPQSQTVGVSNNVSFSVTAEGFPPLSYQWQFNGVNLAGATNATLSLTNVHLPAAGSYAVVVGNAGGSVKS